MASQLTLLSGTPFNGNPITFSVLPQVLTKIPAFHRIIFEIKCGMTGGDFEIIKMSEPVITESGTPVTIDISSALRSFRDSYEYSPEPQAMPVVKFNVTAYDEYMIDGELHPSPPVSYLDGDRVLQTIFGGFSDYDRLMASFELKVGKLSRKPFSSPQLACVGETLVYAVPYNPSIGLYSDEWAAPESKGVLITTEGKQTLGGQLIYALPADHINRRTEFRFINSFGMLESISIPNKYQKKLAISNSTFAVTKKETLYNFSREIVKKTGNREEWMFCTDPLDKEWLAWFLHEFLMAEFAWIKINGVFLPCFISIEDSVTFEDDTKTDMYSVEFSVKLGFNGSPQLPLSV